MTTSRESSDEFPPLAATPQLGICGTCGGSGTDALDEGPYATAPDWNPLVCGISAEGEDPDDTLRLEPSELFAKENPVGDPAIGARVHPTLRLPNSRTQQWGVATTQCCGRRSIESFCPVGRAYG